MRYTGDQFRDHLKQGVGDNCLVCGALFSVKWTDLNGECKCIHCGMTYQIISWKGSVDTLTKLGMRPQDVAKRHCPEFPQLPIYKAYWDETHCKLPLGEFFGAPLNGQDERPTSEENLAFWKWLASKADSFRTEYEDVFVWDKLLERFPRE